MSVFLGSQTELNPLRQITPPGHRVFIFVVLFCGLFFEGYSFVAVFLFSPPVPPNLFIPQPNSNDVDRITPFIHCGANGNTVAMRTLIAALSVISIGTWGYAHFSGASKDFERAMANTVERIRFDKELRFQGLDLLERADLEALVPTERSNFWWEFNRGDVASSLREHALVSAVEVARCGTLEWGCFSVVVTERRPEFVTEFGGKAWLVSADGAFMGRAPRSALDESNTPRAAFNPVLLKGLDFDRSSPDTLKARLDLIRTAIAEIEAGGGEEVRTARLIGASDLEVRFESRTFTVTFGLPDGDTERLRDEVARYNRVLEELGEKHRLVRSIDLAFERVAVVKFIQ